MKRSFIERHACGLAIIGLLFLLVVGLWQKCDGAAFDPSQDQQFLEDVSSRIDFPVAPQGACYDGTRLLGLHCGDRPIMYAMDPGDESWRGHVWLLVGDGLGGWVALDSYSGLRSYTEYPEYCDPPITVSDFGELSNYIPRVAC